MLNSKTNFVALSGVIILGGLWLCSANLATSEVLAEEATSTATESKREGFGPRPEREMVLDENGEPVSQRPEKSPLDRENLSDEEKEALKAEKSLEREERKAAIEAGEIELPERAEGEHPHRKGHRPRGDNTAENAVATEVSEN